MSSSNGVFFLIFLPAYIMLIVAVVAGARLEEGRVGALQYILLMIKGLCGYKLFWIAGPMVNEFEYLCISKYKMEILKQIQNTSALSNTKWKY